jgi:catechol 2,3-dioxygenase-like lactoylglutathione lyase family enzyme
MEVQFVTSVAVIAPDPRESRRLFVDTIGLPLEGEGEDGYFHSERVGGVNHFGVWPLAQAAEACFGVERWPEHLRIPQVSVEFEVGSRAEVEAAAKELAAAGHEVLHPVREEPWGQTVARVLSPEGAIVGISFAPAMHSRD